MAYSQYDGIVSYPAAADYSAVVKNRLVAYNTSGQFALCGVGAIPDGIGTNFPRVAGEQLRAVTLHGIIEKVEVGTGGVTKGASVCSDAAGKIIAGAADSNFVGKALVAGAAGEVVPVLFIPNAIGAHA